METVLLPGLFEEITSFLDDEAVGNLKQQSTVFNRFLNYTQESLGYWKYRVTSLADVPDLLNDIDFDWKKFYKLLKVKNVEEAIVALYPTSQLLSWLTLRVNEIILCLNQRRKTPPSPRPGSIDMSPLYSLLDYIIFYDRIDVFRDFIQLALKYKRLNFAIISRALQSDNSWQILTDLIPEIVEYLRKQRHRGRSSIELINYSVRSSDIAHFMLLEGLFDTSTFRDSVLEVILASGSVEILAVYSRKHSKVAAKYLLDPVKLLSSSLETRIVSFIVEHLTDKEFSGLMTSTLYPCDDEDIDEDIDLEIHHNNINAILNDPRVTNDFVQKVLLDVEYQDSGPVITPDGAANLVRLLDLKIRKLNLLTDAQKEIPLYYILFEYLLTTKKVPPEYRLYFNEMLKIRSIRSSKLRLKGDKTQEFTLKEVRELATFLIEVTEYIVGIKRYYTAKIYGTSLNPIEEQKTRDIIDAALESI